MYKVFYGNWLKVNAKAEGVYKNLLVLYSDILWCDIYTKYGADGSVEFYEIYNFIRLYMGCELYIYIYSVKRYNISF